MHFGTGLLEKTFIWKVNRESVRGDDKNHIMEIRAEARRVIDWIDYVTPIRKASILNPIEDLSLGSSLLPFLRGIFHWNSGYLRN